MFLNMVNNLAGSLLCSGGEYAMNKGGHRHEGHEKEKAGFAQ